jgi:hypothetical protein
MGDPPSGKTRYFRPRRFYSVVGTVCLVFFSIAWIGSTVVAWCNLDGSFESPRRDALFYAVGWLPFVVLAAWIVLFYRRGGLTLTQDSITRCGALRKKTVRLSDIVYVNWRPRLRYRCIVIGSRAGKLIVELDDFAVQDCGFIVSFLRQSVVPEMQRNWIWFEEHILAGNPLIDIAQEKTL